MLNTHQASTTKYTEKEKKQKDQNQARCRIIAHCVKSKQLGVFIYEYTAWTTLPQRRGHRA
jgi:hypothetical protein